MCKLVENSSRDVQIAFANELSLICDKAAIFDSKATLIGPNGKNIILYIWYDNEFGYSHQVIRLAKYIAKVRRFTYY